MGAKMGAHKIFVQKNTPIIDTKMLYKTKV